MKRINRAENWERVHQAFQQVNFSAWDFNTVRESLVDYLKIYYPEDFNDFIESSELVEYINLFAYTVELLSYRLDLNSNENFRTTAQRKESVLRIAKLLSYNSSRNLPARGLVKLSSISTTERVFDSRGTDLTNRSIRWADPTNPNWKEQFLLVINRVLEQPFGTVLPSDRVQVQDALFEVYNIKNSPTEVSPFPFNISVSGTTYQMEVVPTILDSLGPREKRPERFQSNNILYVSDGLGDTSLNSGFFFFVKQGNLQKTTVRFDGITPNQFTELDFSNCNEIDVWVNNINQDTGSVITEEGTGAKIGLWERVDVANSQNIIFNTNPNRRKYEIETLDNDRVRLIFGDGNFSDIPNGTFDLWVRTSANEDLVIPTNAIQNKTVSTSYRGSDGRVQSVKFTFSLLEPIENAVSSESIESIRNTASSVYYTQDRMVNRVDYNTFMLQDNSILKLRAVNRTFAGDSKFLYWKDPREYYENVKIFGDDLVVYFNTSPTSRTVTSAELPLPDGGANNALIEAVINNHILKIFDEQKWFTTLVLRGIEPTQIRKEFLIDELNSIQGALRVLINSRPERFWMVYENGVQTGSWTVIEDNNEPPVWHLRVTSGADGSWEFFYNSLLLNVYSSEVNFWLSNKEAVLEYDSLNRRFDNIVILKANLGSSGMPIGVNKTLRVLSPINIDDGEHLGLQSIKYLNVLPEDEDGDTVPDDISLSYLIPQNSFVYFRRRDINSFWEVVTNEEELLAYDPQDPLWKIERGVYGVNFLWLHRTPRYHLVDPAATNIIDMFVMTRDYYVNYRNWLTGVIDLEPRPSSSLSLRNSYSYLLDSKMISDSVILHPGKIKPIIGKKAPPELRASIKFIRTSTASMTANEIKVKIVDIVNSFFDINKWEFGETFHFTELAATIHEALFDQIDSVVLVPLNSRSVFGDLFQIIAREDEILQPSITTDDIEAIFSLNPTTIKSN